MHTSLIWTQSEIYRIHKLDTFRYINIALYAYPQRQTDKHTQDTEQQNCVLVHSIHSMFNSFQSLFPGSDTLTELSRGREI